MNESNGTEENYSALDRTNQIGAAGLKYGQFPYPGRRDPCAIISLPVPKSS